MTMTMMVVMIMVLVVMMLIMMELLPPDILIFAMQTEVSGKR